ncbi:MAG TPA: TetR/AcrR family transcriptional regulator [Terriglobales bacterium]|nr:TetR/AcrR family transcriptional regulator [Terriglobales bacterium]
MSNFTVTEPILPVTSSHDRILAAAKRLFASQGYEATSTMAIARLAGTSESQMMKHFGSKEGLLEAILDVGWKSMEPALAALQSMIPGPEKLLAMLDVVLNTLHEDPDLKELLLLEGRRIRREGRMVILSPGYVRFVQMVDDILKKMADSGTLRPGLAPEAVRSAIMGMAEGMMRDQVLARRREFPANYSLDDYPKLFALCLKSVTVKPATQAPAKPKAKPQKSVARAKAKASGRR